MVEMKGTVICTFLRFSWSLFWRPPLAPNEENRAYNSKNEMGSSYLYSTLFQNRNLIHNLGTVFISTLTLLCLRIDDSVKLMPKNGSGTSEIVTDWHFFLIGCVLTSVYLCSSLPSVFEFSTCLVLERKKRGNDVLIVKGVWTIMKWTNWNESWERNANSSTLAYVFK